MKSLFRVLAAAPVVLFLALSSAQAGPNVVVSVLPIHSLVAGVMQGIASPILLLKGGASPHTYALKPSDARNLQNADGIFWVGDALESFLAKPIQALPRDAKIVALSKLPAVRLLSIREGGVWAEDAANHHADHQQPAVGTHGAQDLGRSARGTYDPHIWLDPANAAVIVVTTVAVLSGIDPANADTYRANGAKVLRRIEQLEEKLHRHLASVKNRPYVVFHDAYQYFEKPFGMNAVGAISISPERIPGAKRLAALRRRLGELDAACIFAEPQFQPAIVATVAEGTGARSGVLDPLGTNLVPGPDAYFRLLENLAVSLRTCLAAAS